MKRSAISLLMPAVLTGAFSIAIMVGCTPSVVSEESSESDGSTQTVSEPWSPAVDCASCHENEAAAFGDQTTGYGAHATADPTPTCTTCHSDETALSSVHENYQDEKARLPRNLFNTEVTSESCLNDSCHNIDDLLEKTQATPLIDANGTEMNPHQMLTDEAHLEGGVAEANINCSSCHTMHVAGGAESVSENAINTCFGCHHQQTFEACSSCHED